MVLDIFGGPHEWVPLDRGAGRYNRGYTRGGVKVFYDGPGIKVQASGTGCRQLEGEGIICPEGEDLSADGTIAYTWRSLFWLMIGLGCRFTRLDVAIDETAGILSLDVIERKVRDGEYVCRGNKWQVTEGGNTSGATTGKTIYLGSRLSDTFLRMYDKAAQQGEEGHKIRVELELKDERATALAKAIAEDGIEVVPGILRQYLEFKEVGGSKQKTRWEVSHWWEQFLDYCQKLKLAVEPKQRTFERSLNWLRDQVAPTLGMILSIYEGDLDVIEQLASAGKHRWRRWHKDVMVSSAARAVHTGTGTVQEFLPTRILQKCLGDLGLRSERRLPDGSM